MGKRFTWSLDKNRWLASYPDRAVCFEDIVASIETGGLLDDIGHSNSDKYPNQRMYIVLLNGYVFCVPFGRLLADYNMTLRRPIQKLPMTSMF